MSIRYDFESSVEKRLAELCGDIEAKSFLIALSGGADSVSMLMSLCKIRCNSKIELYACHVNHKIRGNEAERDMDFCIQLCKSYKVKLFLFEEDIPVRSEMTGESIELCARNYRYLVFDELCNKHGIDYICTGHNANDNAETVLFNMVRGTGIDGIVGVPPKRGNIIRPILNKTRSEILSYLEEIDVPFVTDSTNVDVDYDRNYIRHMVFPYLKKLNPDVVSAINRLSSHAIHDSEYLEEVAEQELGMKNRKLSEYPQSIKSRMIRIMYKRYCGGELSFANVTAVCDCLNSSEQKRCPLPNKVVALCKDGDLRLTEDKYLTRVLDEKHLCIGTTELFEDVSVSCVYSDDGINKVLTVCLPFNTNATCLVVRSRREGEKITVRGINRSIKKCFLDAKIPAHLRDLIPIICDEQGPLFVPFIGVADRAYISGGPCLQLTVEFDERFWTR